MPEKHLPIYQIQDFTAQEQQREVFFYLRPFAAHLQEHLFIQKPHKHNFFILLLITKGAGSHTIDFKEYPVVPNTIFFLSPGQVHSWDLSEDTDGYIIFFTPSYYLLEFPHKRLINFPFFNKLLHEPLLALPYAEQEKLQNIIQHMQQEHLGKQVMKEDVIRDYLDILLILLKRIYHSHDSGKQIPVTALPLLQALENLIDSNYKEHLPIGFYADKLNVTVKQLNASCKRALGKTTSEVIQGRVLLEAQRLLIHSSLTITQVAVALGYYDNAYFFRFFKKHTGQTPEQFRAAQLVK